MSESHPVLLLCLLSGICGSLTQSMAAGSPSPQTRCFPNSEGSHRLDEARRRFRQGRSMTGKEQTDEMWDIGHISDPRALARAPISISGGKGCYRLQHSPDDSSTQPIPLLCKASRGAIIGR
jgi:hypothetical protein